MSWQDLVFTVGGVIGIIALLPSLRGPDKPAVTTSLMNVFIMAAFGFTDASLGLYFAASTAVLVCIEWGWLAWQAS